MIVSALILSSSALVMIAALLTEPFSHLPLISLNSFCETIDTPGPTVTFFGLAKRFFST